MTVQRDIRPDTFSFRSAEVSPCGRYRWWLRRSFVTGDGRIVCFVMLNPSTADALEDDPTIRRCVGFARAWGFSCLSVRNLFAFRATNPQALLWAEDPVGPQGDAELRAARTADLVVAAWGAHVPFGRDRQALRLLVGVPLVCLGLTKHGHPRHPLYVRSDVRPIPYLPELDHGAVGLASGVPAAQGRPPGG
jgi:hypothetical protein